MTRRRFNGTGTFTVEGYHKIRGEYQHIAIAERALGKPLPAGALVHHVDEDRSNNAPGNLVICPDSAYHNLLHLRMRALAACGHADWRKCKFCGQWDDPARMYVWTGPHDSYAHHRQCAAASMAARRKRS